MRITIEKKQISEMLEAVALKGKYYDGDSAKNSSLSNYAYITYNEPYLLVYNADASTVCAYRHRLDAEATDVDGVVLEIDRTVKYLKGFSGEVDIEFGDYISIKSDTSNANLPKIVSHPSQAMIDKFRQFLADNAENFQNNVIPKFGDKSFETKVTVLADDLLKATKGCDALNLARYKFNIFIAGNPIDDRDGPLTEENAFTMSSDNGLANQFHTFVECIDIEGEESTVEFTGQFAQFLSGPVEIYLRDDFPIFWKTPNRMLLKAPYLNR